MAGRERIAYLGPDAPSEAVSAIVAAHNAALATKPQAEQEAVAKWVNRPPQGYALVSMKQLVHWNEWVSQLAACHLKADRHNVARRFIESINAIRAASNSGRAA